MQDYIDHWKELNIDFDCIYSGFLGSERQIEIVSGFIDDFGTEDNMVVIDPVLGDNGNLYSTMDQGLVEGMKRLVTKADIITPNFTEVSLLLGEEYKQTTTDEEIKEWVKRLSDMGPDIIVVTSVPDKEKDKDKEKDINDLIVSKDTIRQTDVQRIIDEWNTLEEFGITPVKRMTPKREQAVKARIRQNCVEDILEAIENIRHSTFLQGQNKNGWMVTFDWFLKPGNFAKVFEGQYMDKSTNRPCSYMEKIQNRVSEVDNWV